MPGQMVHLDTLAGQFGAQAVGEHENRGLTGRVGAETLLRAVGGHAGQVDDMSAESPLGHGGAEGAAAVDHAAEVHPQHPVEFGGGGLEEVSGLADAGVVDQDVGHAVGAITALACSLIDASSETSTA